MTFPTNDQRFRTVFAGLLILLACVPCPSSGQAETSVADVASALPTLPPDHGKPPPTDWLLDASPFQAAVYRGEHPHELVLSNGLIARTFRLRPNAATVGLDNLVTGQSIFRSVRPEAAVTIDGVAYDVGGLVGQPNHAYLTPAWLDRMTADPRAMRVVDIEVGKPIERLSWKRVRHHAPHVEWPPAGVRLSMTYRLPTSNESPASAASAWARKQLWHDPFTELSESWEIHVSSAEERISFQNEGKPGEIYALGGTHCFAEHKLPAETALVEAIIHPGTDSDTSWGPGLGLVFADRVIEVNLRPGDRGEHGHFELRDDGREQLTRVAAWTDRDGGLDLSIAYRLRVRSEGEVMIWEAAREQPVNSRYVELFRVARPSSLGALRAVRVGKTDRRGGASDERGEVSEWGRCRVECVTAYGALDEALIAASTQDDESLVRVKVNYELYDGLPAMCKWIEVQNGTADEITVDRFRSETLAVVERSNWVETRPGVDLPRPDSLHVETDFAFGGFNSENANRHAVHWRTDPQYTTQVNYLRQTPCLLVVEPTYGPAQSVQAGESFTSFTTFILVHDSTDRERRGLAQRRMYRTIAPWVTENPLMMHMRTAQPDAVRAAIDQCAAVGFEMLILSFGSGFNIENEEPEYLSRWKDIAAYARARDVEIGGYSLLSSRRVGGGNDIVSPPGERPTHGNCPALTSVWGQDYFRKLRRFFDETGFRLLEHDGSYPGDVDVTPRPPWQHGEQDSRWAQWRVIRDFYHTCRAQGVYLNVPDYYFLSGSNKCGMGYREVNWSLPREQQVIHTRQNIYDGTWNKTPSMGWMFVPLTQYHGGGAAATIEPLDQHRDHYRRMLASNLGCGVQACYRGPRLYDTPATQEMVKEFVDWFKQYRDILESDVVHGRRADGRDVDWMLHVNPRIDTKGLLVVYNPLNENVSRTLRVNVYYTGLTDTARISHEGDQSKELAISRDYEIDLPVTVAGQSMTWYVLE